ncbi:MAG: glycosyltransferase [Pseudomonadota bacterium]
MPSDVRARCLLIVYLPGASLPRYPDQMARYDFLRRHYRICGLISSGQVGVAADDGGATVLAAGNPVQFAIQAARALRARPVDYDFIYVIGVPAAMVFALARPARPVVLYAPTHFLQHFGVPGELRGWRRLAAYGKRRLLFAGLRRVAALTAISRQLEALYRPYAPRVLTIPMGVDVSLYAPRPMLPHSGPLKVVYAGSGGAGRGIELVIACARRLLASGAAVEFHLIGCRDAQLEQALADTPALASVLRLWPAMPYADVVRAYGGMDVGLSLLESNLFYAASPPQKIFEYMAAGLPILCNRIATHTDYVGDNALLVDYDADALYQGVLAMAAGYARYQQAAARAARHMAPYAHSTVERSFTAVIETVLAPRAV